MIFMAIQKEVITPDPIPVSKNNTIEVGDNFCSTYMDANVNNYKVNIIERVSIKDSTEIPVEEHKKEEVESSN